MVRLEVYGNSVLPDCSFGFYFQVVAEGVAIVTAVGVVIVAAEGVAIVTAAGLLTDRLLSNNPRKLWTLVGAVVPNLIFNSRRFLATRTMRVLLVVAALPAAVTAQTQTTPGVFQAWQRVPPSIHRPLAMRSNVQDALTHRHRGYQRLRADTTGGLDIIWNEDLETPHRIFAEDLFIGNLTPRNTPGIDASTPGGFHDLAFRSFLNGRADLFSADVSKTLTVAAMHSIESVSILRYSQHHKGIPIVGARVHSAINEDGRLLRVSFDALPTSILDGIVTNATISADMAVTFLAAQVGVLSGDSPITRLVIVPTWFSRASTSAAPLPATPFESNARCHPWLAWEIRTRPPAGEIARAHYIAANDQPHFPAGTLLGNWSLTSALDVSGTARGLSSPDFLPSTSCTNPELSPIANLTISVGSSEVVTDADGWYSVDGLPDAPAFGVQATLNGPFCTVINQAGETLTFESNVTAGDAGDVSFDSASDDFDLAQINAFVAINRAHDFVRSVVPDLDELDVPVLAVVNVDGDCNAYFRREGDGVLEFFRHGSCVNFAYSSIVFHEYGHFVAWKAFGDDPIMPAYDEGIADGFALLLTGEPEVGADHNAPQTGDPACKGEPLRDVSIATERYPDDVLADRHVAGLILGRAIWSLRDLLIGSLGETEGTQVLSRLHLESLLLAPQILSPDIALDFLTVDDMAFGDGNIFNGTPHDSAILEAFSISGLGLPGLASVTHTPLRDGLGAGPYRVQALIAPRYRFVEIDEVNLHFSTDGGGFYQTVPMVAGEGLPHEADLPDAPEGTTLRYYIEVRTVSSGTVFHPSQAPIEGQFFFTSGTPESVFATSFDDGDEGWTHGLVQNGKPETNEDDWELGTIRPGVLSRDDALLSEIADPPSAYSPPSHWGNDLNLDGDDDGNYSSCTHNFLESPPIDCTGFFGTHLRFRRFLTNEHRDRCFVFVNDKPVYETSRLRDVFDRDWRYVDYDVSFLTDNQTDVRIRFEIRSNSSLTAGGWNLDNLELISTGASTPINVTAIQPDFFSVIGGPEFRLFGNEFTEDSEVFFDSVPSTDLALIGPNEIRGTIPPATSPGSTTIVVRTPSGTGILAGGFTYFGSPQIELVSPATADIQGGTEIRISGQFFTPDNPENDTPTTRLWVGQNEVTPLNVVNSQNIRGLLPPVDRPGAVDLRITTSFHVGVFPRRFTYAVRPELGSVAPSRSKLGGGSVFILIGDNFPMSNDGVTVFFGETPVSVSILNETQLGGIIPAAANPGVVDIRLSTPGGQAVLTGAFEYLPAEVFIRGDVDLSGTADISDPLFLLAAIFLGTTEATCEDAGDANDDGNMDITDAIHILRALFIGDATFPPPHLTPGVDPTDTDSLNCEEGLRS